MRKTNNSRHWAVLAVLVGVVTLIAACEGTVSKLPTQPEARNFENPETTIVQALFDCVNGGTKGLTLIFVNNSTGEIDKYFWDFGDNSTSKVKDPVHKYKKIGEYVVILTVSNSISSDTLAQFCTVTGVTEDDDDATEAPVGDDA